jgi:hypothetical protein
MFDPTVTDDIYRAIRKHLRAHLTQPRIQVATWPVTGARTRYGDVAVAIGRKRHGGARGISRHLYIIDERCKTARLPPINAIVVRQRDGLPGVGLPKTGEPIEVTWKKVVAAAKRYPSKL